MVYEKQEGMDILKRFLGHIGLGARSIRTTKRSFAQTARQRVHATGGLEALTVPFTQDYVIF